MKFMLSGPACLILVIVGGLSLLMTQCHYHDVSVWAGNCSPAYVTSDDQSTYVNLQCPGMTRVSKTPATTNVTVVARYATHTLPPSFWCQVSRTGNATCWLPSGTDRIKSVQAGKVVSPK